MTLSVGISYFESILAACPDSVDEVIIEPDGEWHTEDNKYASPGWRSLQQSEAASSKANTPAEEKPSPNLLNGSASNGTTTYAQRETQASEEARAGSSRMQEVVAVDDSDDDDDEPPLKQITRPAVRRILSGNTNESGSVDRLLEDALNQPSANASRSSDSTHGSAAPAAAAEPVIDLTLTDDEEELAGPVLPSWAADIPALAKADKRERSMSSMLEAEDRVALRRRLASNGLAESSRESAIIGGSHVG